MQVESLLINGVLSYVQDVKIQVNSFPHFIAFGMELDKDNTCVVDHVLNQLSPGL